MRRYLLVAVAVVSIAAALFAQTPGLGHISFPTSGSARAQPAFIRGVLFLHSFEYDDAIAAFREAQKIDPGFAMAYWGEAMCYNQPLWRHEDPAKAHDALARLAPTRAARTAKAPTDREKAYLDAVETYFGAGDRATRSRAYADAMMRLMRRYPDDDEAAVFAALAELSTVPEGQRDPKVSLDAGAIASRVLKKNPQHPGAAHVVLHAYDDGDHAAMGLEAARIYARIAPASSHARHMPSHVFLPLGMWDEAAASDESAFAASVDEAKRKGLPDSQQDFHSLSWLEYEYLQQGRFEKARGTLEIVKRALGTAAPGRPAAAASGGHEAHQTVESEIGRGFGPLSLKNEVASMRARYVIESGDWESMRGQASFDNIDELFALGVSSIRLGDLARADAALEHLDTASRTPGERDLADVAKIMADEIRGVLLLLRGSRDQAIAALTRAVDLEARRPRPIGRPYPIKPASELLGEALLALDDPTAALRQFETSLRRTPNRPAALLGIMRAAEALGQRERASRAARDFLRVWHLADPGRGEVAEARAVLKRAGS